MVRVAIVTGGTRGIGAAIAETLHKADYKVAATYHGNDEAAKKFTDATGVPTYKFDVGDFEACKEGVEKITADLGPIDVLVNNAGITRDCFLHKMAPEQWNEVIHTNLNSVFNMSRLVIEGMRERCFGRIISISSINGQAGQVGQTNYSAAKAAIIGFTKALAQESAAKGVTVNAIAPGYIDTEMVRAVPPDALAKVVAKIPLKRLGKPEEIAAMVLFLASNQAAFATGATFTVNGGQYMT
ncbi:MAG: acetoacetyl-CoA reductase [Alphaproteobacteria bacterium]|nr:acetoacetyl-CoA reductase [Alphaproteobacteria bacterium]